MEPLRANPPSLCESALLPGPSRLGALHASCCWEEGVRGARGRIEDLGGETVVTKRRVTNAGDGQSGNFPGCGASHSRRTAHWMAPQPTSFPRTRALSASCPNGAPHGQISGLLRASSSRRRPSCDRLTGSAAANSPARCVAREFVPNIEPVARGRRWWQRAYEPTLWQATVVVRPMRQHSCHRAAAWSTAGALADGNGRRAGRSRARRASAGSIRRLPRCAAPSTSIGTHGTRPCLAAAHRRRLSLRRWLTHERRR